MIEAIETAARARSYRHWMRHTIWAADEYGYFWVRIRAIRPKGVEVVGFGTACSPPGPRVADSKWLQPIKRA
jgi:hypothetical protein